MSFNAQEQKIYDLFNRKTYSIPRNQRRYIWEQRNWEELFDDLIYSINANTSHFLGSFVLKDEGRHNGLPNFTVIDGQQRIITLTILLGSILYWLKKDNKLNDFDGTKLYVFAQDDKAYETLMVKSDYHLSLDSIINIINKEQNNFDKMSMNKLLEEGCSDKKRDKNIVDAFRYFISKIEEFLKLHGNDKELLLKLKDAIVNISYISIISTSEEDSYTIFEILNARGTELEDHELLKNYIMRYIQPEINRDRAKTIWMDLENCLGNNFKKFIKHYTTHRCKYKDSKTSDYKTLQSLYRGNNTLELLDDLQKKAKYYEKMLNPQQLCDPDSVEYRVLSFFRKKRQEQLRPVLLSIIHHHENGDISDKDYENILKFTYNFFICYNIIGEENSNKLTNVVYKYAHLIENNYSESILNDFTEELKKKLPSKEIFQNSFKNIGFSKKNNFYSGEKNKDKVQTVLEVLERFLNHDHCEPDFSIEHILDDALSTENGQIGNLIPLENSINNNLNGKKYTQKIIGYQESSFKTARSFAKRYQTESDFDPKKRTEYLADLFYEKILNFPNT
mgnify:FL=1